MKAVIFFQNTSACELHLCIGFILYERLLRKPRKIAENGEHCSKLCRPSAVQLTSYLCNKTMRFAHSSVKVQRNSCLTAKPFKSDFLLTTACTMHLCTLPIPLQTSVKNKKNKFVPPKCSS